MKVFSMVSLLIITIIGCEKQQNQKLLGPYLKYEVSGVQYTFAPADLLNNNHFDCTITGDSSLNIAVSKLFEGAGFYIKAKPLPDGTYTLDERNRGYFTNPKDYRRYYTNETYKGTLTIKRNVFQAKTLLNTLEGKFSFDAIDTATHKAVYISNGEFLMEVQ